MLKSTTTITLAIIAALVLLGLCGWYLTGNSATPVESVTVAYSPYELGALFWIAQDQHFFENNGLNVSTKKYYSGAASLDGVLNGEADITVGVAEFPLVTQVFRHESACAMGTIDKSEIVYLVARKDRIANASDLRGKRIGTARGTSAEFYLGRFLILHGMTMQDITLVDVRTPDGWVNEVANGTIDAIVIGQPYANAARDRLGDNAIVYPAQGGQPLYALAVSTDGWIAQHPGTSGKFLKSLAQAEEFANAHPAESRAIIAKQAGLDPGYLDTSWKNNQFSLTLDQSVVAAMEDEGRWMIANNLTPERTVPDFRKYICSKSLEEIKPGSVRIIG